MGWHRAGGCELDPRSDHRVLARRDPGLTGTADGQAASEGYEVNRGCGDSAEAQCSGRRRGLAAC